MSDRTATAAAIKRATAEAQAAMDALDTQILGALTDAYSRASADIQAAILAAAGPDGSVSLNRLQDLQAQIDARMAQLEAEKNALLNAGLQQAAELGAQPLSGHLGVTTSTTQIAEDAVKFVTNFIAQDGLQLSDRVWRVDNGARQAAGSAIQSGIIQGHSASQAAQDFIAHGAAIPADVLEKQGMAQASKLAKSVADGLMKNEGNPYSDALRLFRTELNRAHGEAYQHAAFQHPDCIGTQFLLSPNHPRRDICDMHAHANLYGLGAGVYPKGKSPWPAHPNTLSYVVAVFADEVTPADRAGKTTEIDWLKQQDAETQLAVLGAAGKVDLLNNGKLRRSEIKTPWRVLEKKYAQ